MGRQTSHAAPAAVFLAAVAVAAALVSACAPAAGEDEVAERRADYSAELNSFYLRQTPVVVETAVVESAAEPGAEATTEAVEPTAEAPVRRDIVLDIMVRSEADERLPGVTLDVSQVDEQENAKATYRVWVDTADLPAGARKAVTQVLEDVDYAEGDGFRVEVRAHVPPEDRAEYREFAEAGGPS
jgi:hypothetical protein